MCSYLTLTHHEMTNTNIEAILQDYIGEETLSYREDDGMKINEVIYDDLPDIRISITNDDVEQETLSIYDCGVNVITELTAKTLTVEFNLQAFYDEENDEWPDDDVIAEHLTNYIEDQTGLTVFIDAELEGHIKGYGAKEVSALLVTPVTAKMEQSKLDAFMKRNEAVA